MSSVAFEIGWISDIVQRQMDLISRYVALVKQEKRSVQPLVAVSGFHSKHNLAV